MKLRKLGVFLVLAATTFSFSVVYADNWNNAYQGSTFELPQPNPGGCQMTKVGNAYRCGRAVLSQSQPLSCTEGYNGMGVCAFVGPFGPGGCIKATGYPGEDPLGPLSRNCKCNGDDSSRVNAPGLCPEEIPMIMPDAVAVEIAY